MNADGTDGVVPQLFRLAVQQLINNCRRHLNSSSGHVSAISADALLNRQESTLSIVKKGIIYYQQVQQRMLNCHRFIRCI